MKDFYEYLNDIPINDADIEEIETDELEKRKLKNKLRNKLKGGHSGRRKAGIAAAAVICAVIGSTAAIGIANPAFAANIPIIGDIFRFIDSSGSYELFQSNAEHMGYTVEDNGVKITLEDAIFDGKNIFCSYSIETEANLGEIISSGSMCSVKGYYGGMGGSEIIKKAYDRHYAGICSITLDENLESADIKLEFDTIYYEDESGFNQKEGEWQFKFRLDAVEGDKTELDLSSEKNNVRIDITSITINPMAFTLDYTLMLPESMEDIIDASNCPSIRLDVKNDLGNRYEEIGGAGFGNSNIRIEQSLAFGNLSPEAKELIITPTVIVPTGGGGVAIDDNGNETSLEFIMRDEIKSLDGLELDSIIIPLK